MSPPGNCPGLGALRMSFTIRCAKCGHTVSVIDFLYRRLCPECHHEYQILTGYDLTSASTMAEVPPIELTSGLVFKPIEVEQIINRQKTQTRRIWYRKRYKPGQIIPAKTSQVKMEGVCRLLVKECYAERLGDISAEDAEASGGYTQEEYFEAFKERYPDRIITLDQKVWVIRFEPVGSPTQENLNQAIATT